MKKLLLIFAILSLLQTSNLAFAQIPNLVGTWESMVFYEKNVVKPCYTLFRTFDEKSNYVQIEISPNGMYIVGKASFELSADGKVKEVINFAANPDRIGKTFNFTYQFIINNGVQLLITEGGKKIVNGVETVEWREVWRRVEEFKK